MTVVNTVIVSMMSIEADSLSNVDGTWIVFSAVCPMWAQKSCRISPPRLLAMCCKRRLNQGSFVLLHFASFACSELYLVCVFVSGVARNL